MPKSPVSLVVMGANGRVGRLLQAAWKIAPSGLHVAWQSREGPCDIRWSLADGDQALARSLGGADVLLVLAGITPAAGADYSQNAALALAALSAARMAGVGHVILASSSAVYALPHSTAALTEQAALAPATPYGIAKLQMEQAVAGWQGTGLTTLRIGNVAGTDQLFRAMAAARTTAPLLLDRFASGQTPSRSYIGPVSLADVIARLAHRAVTSGLPPVLNIGAPGGGLQMGALLSAMATAGHPVPHRYRAAPPQALPALHLDTALQQAVAPVSRAAASAQSMVAEWLHLQGPPA